MMKMYEHIGNHKHQYKSNNKKIHGNQTNYIKINKTKKNINTYAQHENLYKSITNYENDLNPLKFRKLN